MVKASFIFTLIDTRIVCTKFDKTVHENSYWNNSFLTKVICGSNEFCARCVVLPSRSTVSNYSTGNTLHLHVTSHVIL